MEHHRRNTKETEAQSIKLWIGLGGESGTHRFWKEWEEQRSNGFSLAAETRPARQRDLDQGGKRSCAVATVSSGSRNGSRTTQRMKFDKDEEHETSQDDED